MQRSFMNYYTDILGIFLSNFESSFIRSFAVIGGNL